MFKQTQSRKRLTKIFNKRNLFFTYDCSHLKKNCFKDFKFNINKIKIEIF